MMSVSTMVPNTPKLCVNTLRASVAFVAPLVHSPEISTVSAVMVQTMNVSTKTSNEPHRPCSMGWRVLLDAWTIGLEPQPASLEYTLRAIPVEMTCDTVAPAKPPTAAEPVNAWLKMAPSVGRMFS